MNAKGKATVGAFAPKGKAAGPGLTFDGLTAPDMGKKTAIRLLLGLSGESSLFELRIEVHGPAIRAGV
jgi:hypothetical protein